MTNDDAIFALAVEEVIDDAVEEAVREAEPTAESFEKVWKE